MVTYLDRQGFTCDLFGQRWDLLHQLVGLFDFGQLGPIFDHLHDACRSRTKPGRFGQGRSKQITD